MSFRLRVCTTIEAPPEVTWSAIARIETHVEWMADAEAIRFTSVSREGVGTEFECDTKVGFARLTDRMSITEWRPGVAMGVDHRGVVRGTGRFDLSRLGDNRTRFCWDERLTLPWWMGGLIGELAARPVLARLWRGNLARLKDVVERDRSVAAHRPDRGAVPSSRRPR